MNWSIFKELFKINLIYSNPNLSSQEGKRLKKKGRTDKSILGKLILSNILQIIFMTFIYTFILIPMPLDQAPFIFDQYVIFLLVLGVIQSFMMFYNVIYDSKDLVHYLPLPISSSEIYLSKILTVAFTSAIFVVPIVSMSFLYLYRIGYSLGSGLLLSLYLLAFVFLLYLLINILLMEALAASGILYRFKNSVLVFLNILVQVGAVLFIVKSQGSYSGMYDDASITGPVQYGPISGLFASPQKVKLFLGLSLVISLLALLIIRQLGRNFMDHYMAIQTKKSRVKKKQVTQKDFKIKSLKRIIFRYKWTLLQDATIFSTTVISTFFLLFLPILIVLPQKEIQELIYRYANNIYLAFCIFIALALALFPMNLPEIIISLDNENYKYMKALPLDVKNYIKINTYFTGLIYLLPSFVIALGLGLYFGVAYAYLPLGLILTSSLFLPAAYKKVLKDYQKPVLGWQNAQELFNRGGKGKQLARMLAYYLFAYGFMAGFPVLLSFLAAYQAILLCLVLVLVFDLFNAWRIKKLLAKI